MDEANGDRLTKHQIFMNIESHDTNHTIQITTKPKTTNNNTEKATTTAQEEKAQLANLGQGTN